jgi:hypothetical protein
MRFNPASFFRRIRIVYRPEDPFFLNHPLMHHGPGMSRELQDTVHGTVIVSGCDMCSGEGNRFSAMNAICPSFYNVALSTSLYSTHSGTGPHHPTRVRPSLAESGVRAPVMSAVIT